MVKKKVVPIRFPCRTAVLAAAALTLCLAPTALAGRLDDHYGRLSAPPVERQPQAVACDHDRAGCDCGQNPRAHRRSHYGHNRRPGRHLRYTDGGIDRSPRRYLRYSDEEEPRRWHRRPRRSPRRSRL